MRQCEAAMWPEPAYKVQQVHDSALQPQLRLAHLQWSLPKSANQMHLLYYYFLVFIKLLINCINLS